MPANVTATLKLADDAPRVTADPDQLGLVFANLITNAAQAMPDGGTLTIEAAPVDGQVRVTIADTGMGIEPEHIAKIFQPLFTTKPRGIGLGLSVAKSLTEGNGGTISLETAPGRGTRFLLQFPQAPHVR